MKKLVYGAALLVVAGASFAFLPKEENADELMMILTITGYDTKITTISSNGTTDSKSIELDKKFKPFPWAQAHQVELAKLHELQQQGWHVARHYTNSFAASNYTSAIEVVYTLEKR